MIIDGRAAMKIDRLLFASVVVLLVLGVWIAWVMPASQGVGGSTLVSQGRYRLHLPPSYDRSRARVAFVMAPRPEHLREVAGVVSEAVDWPAITTEDLEQHLCGSWGLSEEEGRREAHHASGLALLERAGLLYMHVEKIGRLWEDG